jgi:putative Mg2+ transporter-C (MgtC) family protein
MSPDLTMAVRLLLAAVLGGVIGFQRERAGKPAGLRTHMLICIGSTLFTLVGIFAFSGGTADPLRVAAGVVSGIGFLGAGAIIFRSSDGYIAGLTTAATIWAVAGIGMAVGAGLYLAAAVATAIILIILFIPHIK